MGNDTERAEQSTHQLYEQTMRNCKKADIMSNIAIICGVLSILINALTEIDKIESFVQHILSYLH